MNPKDMPLQPPAPKRVPKQQLSLKAAMAFANKAPGHQAPKPLMNPMDEFPLAPSGGQQDMEAYLLELQADIINREELLNQREKKFSARELELNERTGPARGAHSKSSKRPPAGRMMSRRMPAEAEAALAALKQDTGRAGGFAQRRPRDAPRSARPTSNSARTTLVEQSMMLTEREARVEQSEEDFATQTKSINSSPAATETDSAQAS